MLLLANFPYLINMASVLKSIEGVVFSLRIYKLTSVSLEILLNNGRKEKTINYIKTSVKAR